MIRKSELPAVVSRGRNGTHWLCSLIYQWFYYGQLHKYGHDSILPFATWGDSNAAEYPWADLLGGHINSPDSDMARALKPRKIIYLFRTALESLPSLWRLRMAEAKVQGRPTISFPAYLKRCPPQEPGNPFPEGLNVRDLTDWSQDLWLKDRNNWLVSYGQMTNNMASVKDSIADFLGMEPVGLSFPSSTRVGYLVPQGEHTNQELWEMVR